ncbi:MAG TPA: helix-turn-helix domain-containing protein [Solirubrobacterales bacterium]|nr:helix-turn-helix domain-containing protein [Solirubrobacterales bacterium]
MDTGIGATLREARNRRKVDLSEVEAAIKIRVRYLQAMENEEWDALPGGAYTRGFIRTYASYLGLDGERLADDFRRNKAPSSGERPPRRVEPVPASARMGRPRIPGRVLVAAVSLVLIAVVVAIGLAGGDGGPSSSSPSAGSGGSSGGKKQAHRGGVPAQAGVTVQLAATAEVWVCLLDGREQPLVDGQILEEGAEAGPFRSGSFEVALGNGSVTMVVDGKKAEVPASSSPVGYRVDSGGELIALEEGERPDCE